MRFLILRCRLPLRVFPLAMRASRFMKRLGACLVAAFLIGAPPADARILTLARAHPWGNSFSIRLGVTPLGGIASNLRDPYPWSQVTIAYRTTNGDVLVGCRGEGIQTVRVWTHGHGWKLTTCIGLEPWRVVLRHITPDVNVHSIVTFR